MTSSLHLRCFDDAAEFLQAVTPTLARREIENSWLLGTARWLIESQKPALLAALFKDGAIAVAGLRVLSNELALSTAERADIETFADALIDMRESVPSIIAVESTASTFAERWSLRTGDEHAVQHAMTYYALTTLIFPPVTATGHLRAASLDDLPWLAERYVAFATEVGLSAAERQPQHALAVARARIEKQQQFVWEDGGKAVAIVAYVSTGLNGARIMGVLTEPWARRHGYASAAVAGVSRALVDSGKWCGLFADVANPQSNRLYQRLGYEEVCRFRSIRFMSGEATSE